VSGASHHEPLLRLLGLGANAGSLVIGVSGVRARLQQNAVQCVMLAEDASARTREKVERLAVARGIPVLAGPSAEGLGRALGRAPVQAVGVLDTHLAHGLLQAASKVTV
jgi:ribosomal protein L7Ae-like RNA K-turn-binding protein